MVRYLAIAAGMLAIAGTPALFASDLGYDRRDLQRDYAHVARQNADIRRDQWRLQEDLEHGRFGRAARERADLNRDYAARNAQLRDIHRDRRDIRRDERWR
jgi:hypothetical protein